MKKKSQQISKELSSSNEKMIKKTTDLCSTLKQTRTIAKKSKKVCTNLKKV